MDNIYLPLVIPQPALILSKSDEVLAFTKNTWNDEY